MASWLIFSLGLLLSSCQLLMHDSEARLFSSDSKNTQNTHRTKQDYSMVSITVTQEGLPQEINSQRPIWEVQRSSTATKSGFVTRLYESGQLYTWSNSRRILVDGLPSREPAPYAWRLDAKIKLEGVEKVKELIRSDFLKLASEEPNLSTRDQGLLKFTTYVDGNEYAVSFPASAYDELPGTIKAIEQLIQRSVIPGGVTIQQ